LINPKDRAEAVPLPIDIEFLKSERDKQKAMLREVEVEQRKLEADLKVMRQKEIRAKREIDALSTLIELQEVRADAAEPATTPG
jgi:hypothetical protein